jgi:hypothetical protein
LIDARSQLLEKDPAERLGVSDSLHGDITQHNFFKSIDFGKLERKELRPPYTPDLVSHRVRSGK